MNKYLKNTYVLLGLAGLGIYLYKRKQILEKTPEASKPIEEVETETIEEVKDNFAGVPEKLKRDSAKMSKQTLKRTIITNQKMLKRARLSEKKRKQIIKALNYLKQEYKNR